MLDKKMSKSEVEKFLEGKGDYVKIDYLMRFLKEGPAHEMKKFVYLKLATIYEKNSMFADAAKMWDNLAIASIAFSEKIKNYMKETELYIKSGNFNRADDSMKKAMGEANATQRNEIFLSVKEFYKRQAEVHEKNMQRNRAAKIYEKLLMMKISETEKEEIKEKLLRLYEKLGRFEEAKRLR